VKEGVLFRLMWRLLICVISIGWAFGCLEFQHVQGCVCPTPSLGSFKKKKKVLAIFRRGSFLFFSVLMVTGLSLDLAKLVDYWCLD